MKTINSLIILILALGLMVCQAGIGEAAEPMSTAFTYQGRLIDGNSPANGEYDLQFQLHSTSSGSFPVSDEIFVPEKVVDDGYFTVVLDFNDANLFNGEARWLQVGVRPGDQNDPNRYTPLEPRPELTPTPYAHYARVAVVATDSIRGGGTSNYIAKFADSNTIEDSLIYQSGARIGIGTENPDARLFIQMLSGSSPIDVDGLVIRNGLLNNGDYLEVRDFSGNPELVIRDGRIGVGTTSPEASLHLKGAGWPDSFVHLEGDQNCDTGIRLYEGATAKWHLFNSTADSGLRIYNSDGSRTVFFAEQVLGEVGINTTSPTAMLDVWSGGTNRDVIKAHASDGSQLFKVRESPLGNGDIFLMDSDGATKVLLSTYGPTLLNGGNVGIGVDGLVPTAKLEVVGRTKTSELEITGGSDLSEHFNIVDSGDRIEPGMVVCIDPESPGKLVLSHSAYDRKVAGIVSGAGGVRPGLLMGQRDSVADGAYAVALTGRVYCRADASSGSIQPGDLLTTSDTPGYAMAVGDYKRAQGAIIGKAMSRLQKGTTGLVLVLVNLQ